MDRRRYLIGMTCVGLLAVAAGAAQAQGTNYPTRTVSIICDAAAGSTPDVVARFVADGLGRAWGQQVVVVNHPGGGGSIAAHAASEAAPDGHTLFMPALSAFVAQPGVAPNIPIQVPRDFTPIGFTAENPMFVAVKPTLGVKTMAELIALAKKEPAKITIAATGIGRLTHLTGELLQMRTGIKLLTVPYTAGPAMALGDVIGGRVDMIIEGYSGIASAIRAGSVKPIAVASGQHLPEFPDLPTIAETVPGFTANGWQILVAPRGTPEAVIRKVAESLTRVVNDPDIKQKLAQLGSYTRAMSPAEATAFVQQEQQNWKPALEKIAENTK
jgi:tripartite-type tricarboxylate transporter receptor subunit TctC